MLKNSFFSGTFSEEMFCREILKLYNWKFIGHFLSKRPSKKTENKRERLKCAIKILIYSYVQEMVNTSSRAPLKFDFLHKSNASFV